MFNEDQIEQLKTPLSDTHVKKNKRGFDYIEGYHAINEANRIFGFGSWSSEVLDYQCILNSDPSKSQHTVAYTAHVRVTTRGEDGNVQHHDGLGYGDAQNFKAFGLAHESAIKEAETDAIKRCLIKWGNQFGLALYDKAKENVKKGQPKPTRGPQPNETPKSKPKYPDYPYDMLNEVLKKKEFSDEEIQTQKAWAVEQIKANPEIVVSELAQMIGNRIIDAKI